MLRALAACLDGVFDGVDFQSILTAGGGVGGSLKRNAFSQFGIPLIVENSSIKTVAVGSEDKVITVNLSGIKIEAAHAQVEPGQTRKSFWLQNILFRKLLGDGEIVVALEDVCLGIGDEIKATAEKLTFSWKAGALAVIVKGTKIEDGDFVVLEKECFEVSCADGIKCNVDELVMHFHPERFASIAKYVNGVRSMFEHRNVEMIEMGLESEEERNEVESITSEQSETPQGFQFDFDTVTVVVGNVNCGISCLKWNSSGVNIEKVNIEYLGKTFCFERINYEKESRKFHILKFSSEHIKQEQVHFPFLVTRNVDDNCACILAELKLFGTLEELGNTMSALRLMLSVVCNCFGPKESLLIQIPFLTALLESGIRLSFRLKASLNRGVYQLGIEKAKLWIDGSDPIINRFSVQLSDDGKLIRVLVAPCDVRVTFAELKLLVERGKTIVTRMLPLQITRPVQMNMVTTDIVLCREVNGTKHNGLMLSLNYIVMNVTPGEDNVDVSFLVTASLRAWNPLTSFWDFVVQPFSTDILISFVDLNINFHVKIGTPVAVTLGSSLLTSFERELTESYGSQTIRIENCLTESIKVLTPNKVEHKLKQSGSNPNLKHMVMKRDKSCTMSESIKTPDQTLITIASGEVKSIDTSVSTPIEIVEFNKTFRLNQIYLPIFLSPDVVVTPIVEKDSKTLQIAHRCVFHNLLSKPIRLFMQADKAAYIEEIAPGGTFPIFVKEENILFTFGTMKDSAFPDTWYKVSDVPCTIMTEFSSFVVSKRSSSFRTVYEVRSLYVVTNELPFPLICTFISPLFTCTVDIDPMKQQDVALGDDNIHNFGLTCCVNPLGITNTVQITRIPCIEKLQIDFLVVAMSAKRTEIGQYNVKFFAYSVIYNCLDRPVFVRCNDRPLHAMVVGDVGNRKPIFIPPTMKGLSLSIDEDKDFVPIPNTSSHVDLAVGEKTHFPIFVDISETQDGTKIVNVKPCVMIQNDLDIDLVFTVNENSFTVKASERKSPDFVNDKLTFALSAERDGSTLYYEIEMISLSAPTSTVFRFSDEMSEMHIHLRVDIVDDVIIATFAKALIPYPFVIVNETDNLPVFAQQIETSMPVRIEPNSAKFFAFDAPFAEPAIMLTISGKSQLVPLHSEIEGTLLPMRIGPNKITVDLITHDNGITSLILSTKPRVEVPKPSISFAVDCEGMTISLLDSQSAELLLTTFNKLNVSCRAGRFDLSIGSFQIDDQTSSTLYGVIMRSTTAPDGRCLHCVAEYHRNLLNIRQFTMVVQPIDLQIDDFVAARLVRYYDKLHLVQDLMSKVLADNQKRLTIQQFNIHPMTWNVCFWHRPKQRRSSGGSSMLPKCVTVGLRSISAQDLNITPACLRHMLLTHYGHFCSLVVSEFRGTPYNMKPLLCLSRFQCSSLISEFYQDIDTDIEMCEHPSLPSLTSIEVFPVAEGQIVMSIDYTTQRLITVWPLDSHMSDTQRLGKRTQSKITYAFRITRMTQDQVSAEVCLRKSLKEAHETDTLLFLEYCETRQCVVCITTRHLFFYDLPTKRTTDIRIQNMSNLSRDGNRLRFQHTIPKKWRSSVSTNTVDFETEELAEQAHLIITSLAQALSM